MKKLSVITINFNNAIGLKKTIQSVLSQKRNDLELIVIDGGSNDESVNVIAEFSTQISYWVSEKDKGIYQAQNKGIEKAGAEYCLFLNSGDTFADEKVLHDLLPELSNADIFYGDLVTEEKGHMKVHRSSPMANPQFFIGSTIWHPTAFIRRKLFDEIGKYNEEFRITGDYEFFIRAILRYGAPYKYVSRVIASFDLGGLSNKAENKKIEAGEREKSWQLNFSDAVIEAVQEHSRILRSGELKYGKMIGRVLKPFKK